MTCYAKHIQTLTGNGLIQKIEQMQKKKKKKKRTLTTTTKINKMKSSSFFKTDKLLRDMKELIITK